MFQDRLQAGRLLAERLWLRRAEHPLVLAVPRGAVPMAAEIARALDGELDVVLVHKIGAPSNEEYAVAAVDERGELLLHPEVQALGRDWLRHAADHQLAELRRRRWLFTPGRGALPVAGRTVIVVDDGVATGATLLAALRMVRSGRPRRLIAAVAVASPRAVAQLAQVADEVVCLEERADLFAVGEAFVDFAQVEDDEVAAILRRADAARTTRATRDAGTAAER